MKEQKNNIGMKVLSVFIAIIIWLLVANTNDPVVTKRFSNIPVNIVDDEALTDQGYAYEVTEGDEVSISVKGKNSIIGNMTEYDFVATADFSKLSVVDAVPIDITAKKYADQLEITLGNTNTMKIKKDAIVNISVPVNIEVKGEVAEGYAVGKLTGTPNLVKVKGPENLLSSAKEIRAEVDVDGISQDVTTTASAVLCDENGNTIDSNQIEMDSSTIAVSIELWKTKTVKVNLEAYGDVAKGYQLISFDYEPKKVSVAAPEEVLDDLSSISLSSISLDGLTKDYEEDIDLSKETLPDDVILADDTIDIKAKATVEEIKSHKITFEQKDIKVKNNTNKYKVNYDSQNKYVLVVDGADSVINQLTINDFDPWIDLSGMAQGTGKITVHVKDVDNVAVDSTPEIQITLR